MGLRSRTLFLVSLGLALALGSPPAAHAEGDPSLQSWRPILPPPRSALPRQPAETYRARRRYDAPRPRFPDDAGLGLNLPDTTVAMPAVADASRLRIGLVGDSMAEALAFGMETDPGMKADLLIRQKTVSASGLVREDFHDWPKAIAALIGDNPGLSALVVMVGLNDRQVIRLGETTLEPLSEPWREAYRRRVDAVIGAAQNARIPLVWVGMPIMRTPKLSTDLAAINEIVRERVSASGETYVEIFDSFADQSGGFTANGPDVIGDIVRLRGPDGIHFTPAGQRKLAFFVDKPLRKRIGDREPPQAAAPLALSPLSPSAPVGPPANEISIPIAVPAALAIPKPRQAIGDIRPLTAVNAASALIGRQPQPIQDPATRDLFDRGLSQPPRAGRSDDFRWR